MRWLALSVIGILGSPRDAEACSPPGNGVFQAGPRVESVPPSEVTLSHIGISRGRGCGSLTLVSITVEAIDDTTPAADLGYRVRFVRGFPNSNGTSADLSVNQQTLSLTFAGDTNLDFELGMSAIDLSGNVGPETVIPIFDEAPTGCNSGRTWSLLPGVAVLGLVMRRRRYRP